MLVIHVHIRVKPDAVEAFVAASLDNARQSLLEPGIARFDVVQDREDGTRFVLVEAYRTSDAPDAHKATPHYRKWRDTVESMMAEPRRSAKHTALFPDDSGW